MAYVINPDRTKPWNDLPELPIDKILLQEAKASSAVENIFTTDDELYKAYSENPNN